MAAAVAEPGLSGPGIGWRPEIAGVVADVTDLGFTEVIAESLAPAAPPRGVAELRERGVAVVPHGVRLSLGGTDPLDAERVTHLAACAAAVDAPLVSEHVSFVRAGGRDAGHLLPVPRTREALDVLAVNIGRLQTELDVPLALEPIAALFDWPDDEFTEGEFLTRLLDRTGTRLLLDVANVYANAVNRGRRAEAVLDTFPLDRIAYVHIAGGEVRDGLRHDTHTAAVPDAALTLLTALVDRLGHSPAVLLERDGRYPPAAALHAELAAIRTAARTGRATPQRESTNPARRDRESGTPGSAGPPTDGRSQLVATLVAGADPPPGFDPARLDATRRALLRKRAGRAAALWPLLAASLGDGWAAAFTEHHAGHEPQGALRDGWDLARAVRTRGGLAAGAARELAARERSMHYDGVAAPRPRLRARLMALLRPCSSRAGPRRRPRHMRPGPVFGRRAPKLPDDHAPGAPRASTELTT